MILDILTFLGYLGIFGIFPWFPSIYRFFRSFFILKHCNNIFFRWNITKDECYTVKILNLLFKEQIYKQKDINKDCIEDQKNNDLINFDIEVDFEIEELKNDDIEKNIKNIKLLLRGLTLLHNKGLIIKISNWDEILNYPYCFIKLTSNYKELFII